MIDSYDLNPPNRDKLLIVIHSHFNTLITTSAKFKVIIIRLTLFCHAIDVHVLVPFVHLSRRAHERDDWIRSILTNKNSELVIQFLLLSQQGGHMSFICIVLLPKKKRGFDKFLRCSQLRSHISTVAALSRIITSHKINGKLVPFFSHLLVTFTYFLITRELHAHYTRALRPIALNALVITTGCEWSAICA